MHGSELTWPSSTDIWQVITAFSTSTISMRRRNCALLPRPSAPFPWNHKTIISNNNNNKKRLCFVMHRDDTNNVTTGTNCSVTSSQVSLILWVVPRWISQELEGPWRRLPLSQRWTPWAGVDKPACTYSPPKTSPRFPHGLLKVSSSPKYPPCNYLDHSGRMHRKSNATKVTHPSTIMTLRILPSVTMGFSSRPWV